MKKARWLEELGLKGLGLKGLRLVALGLVAITATAAALPSEASAQGDVTPMDRETVDAVVSQVIEFLNENYVFPDVAERYAQGLEQRAREYPAGMTPSELAARVTADLQAIQRDRHLQLVPSPESVGQAPPAGAPPVAATAEQLFTPFDLAQLPEVGRSLFADEISRNHFFRTVEVLPGNVGYLDYDQFGFPNFSTDAADAAFAFLAETDAIIIDLRGNRGGVEGMNQYLASHFFGDERVHLYSRFYGSFDATLEYMTFPDRVKRHFPDTPLFLLVNGRTGSAAENFSFALQGLDRATIVGDTTAGAAHSSRPFPLTQGFLLQLPVARSYNPRTDEDWEGRGVVPDIPVDADEALDVAHTAAIDALLESANPDDTLALEDAKLLMAARSAPPANPADYAAYVGNYGARRVFIEDGNLKMVRTDVPNTASVDLVPLAPDYFTLQQAAVARIRFERNDAGDVVRIHVRLPMGGWAVGDRQGG